MVRILRALLVVTCLPLAGEEATTITVDARQSLGAMKPVWGFFGYDEPNYTYTQLGEKLIRELGALAPTPVYIRTHNLLTTGDGVPALKWGSTNAYTEADSGAAVYNWSIVDRILTTYLNAHAKPFVEIGFMPEALSRHAQPYRHHWPNGELFTGWTYPPTDYARWSELVFQWVKHSVERYGKDEVASWYWEVWNEPDIGYWHGTPEEYDQLYDFAVAAVKRALPDARVGGPATTGPAGARATDFLRQFLEHCDTGKNHATGMTGAPLDFISFHAKGKPEVVNGHPRMGLARNLQDVRAGFEIVRSIPKFQNLPIILSESDPEGCAACPAKQFPQNAYRNDSLYASYTAAALNAILDLAESHQANLSGMLTWAFEFEDQPYFAGFRTLATNGIDKPILNLFRMCGLMQGRRVKVESTGHIPAEEIVAHGVREKPDIDALAAAGERSISILIWNYHDDQTDGVAAPVTLTIKDDSRLPERVLLQHYRIDAEHSNAYSVWRALGSPQAPTADQYKNLEQAAQLQLLNSPAWLTPLKGEISVHFDLPRQGISLLRLSW